MQAKDAKLALQKLASPEKAKNSQWFFKTGPGQYGEGDRFIGITVPEQRMVAKAYRTLALEETIKLLRSPIHEHRLTALFILVDQYKRGDEVTKKIIANFYYDNRAYVNNWDLVDGSAPYILGDYLLTRSPQLLFELAVSQSLWNRRIAIIATFAHIRSGQLELTLQIADMLLKDQEDLIHKAVGWALREVGKKNEKTLTDYLDKHAKIMPRTCLRYAIERLTSEQRAYYMLQKTS